MSLLKNSLVLLFLLGLVSFSVSEAKEKKDVQKEDEANIGEDEAAEDAYSEEEQLQDGKSKRFLGALIGAAVPALLNLFKG